MVAAMSLEVNLALCLPSDAVSVPLARHICRFSLKELGVTAGCLADVTLALTEACTNVLDHAADGVEYQVHLTVDGVRCVIRVKDAGQGFDYEALGQRRAMPTAESGRGLELIRALVDKVAFATVPEEGTIVYLEKDLEFEHDHPVGERLARERPSETPSP